MTTRPTIVFGLDGAHYELLEPWIEAGHLPNIERAIDSGISADLESVLPPVTSPNWKAYATGKNPGKIGIFWWENIDTDNRRVHYPSNRKHVNTEFWELIARDEPVGVLGVPTTYPPKDVDSFLVSGPPDGKNTGYAHPSELESRLDEEFDYRVRKHHRLDGEREAAAEEILELIDSRFTAAEMLRSEHDVSFLQVTTFYINSLQHYLWDDEYTLQGWQIIDEHLGQYLDGDFNVVLMSDHGSNPIRTVFHINAWLEANGYLATDTDVADTFYRAGITKDRLIQLTNKLGLTALAKRIAPRKLLQYLPDNTGAVNKEGKTDAVDWEATDAIASGQGPIYLTADRGTTEYDRIRDQLQAELESTTDPDGNAISDAVYKGEEVYSGSYVDESPDLVIDQTTGAHIPGGIGREEIFTKPTEEGWRAENKRQGLFVATGPDFAGGTHDPISILDLAPTLLHLHDRPIPADMDGTVQQSIFDPDSDSARREVRTEHISKRKQERARIRVVAADLDL
ncbi:alkaline phosphatase family protein [Natrinema zhouii]|uniref:Alkaline phosphatase family protein n=1 Tax=Natrinema zhouii TaxID=1710539 RepID=A0A7D6CPI9_9EURY|nr:alkaline phosphatase family protein [Natrinema zhouii]QLK26817.1 alkaline phosphatase family protein [Natrinema zhouii]